MISWTRLTLFALFAIAFQTLFVSDAYAYLDPSTGSMFIHVIIGAIVGVGVTLKVYWLKIKYKISSIRDKNN